VVLEVKISYQSNIPMEAGTHMHQQRTTFRLGVCRLVFSAIVVGGSTLGPYAAAQQTGSSNLEASTRQEPSSDDIDSFYHPERIQVIHLQVSPSNLDKMKSALPKRIYVPATFRWGDQTIENVGVRYKGNSSSNPNQRHKRSFLIKFSEYEKGRSFLGLERVALDNGVQFGSLFGEQLITGILHELKIPASRCNFAKLYLNGEYHGVYTNVERIDSVFVKTHFGDGKGPLYKNDAGGAGASLDLVQPGRHPNGGPALAFEPKSKAARDDARDVLELISRINQTANADFAKVMEETIDVEAFLQTMAVMLFSGAFDQLTGVGPHNYYLYHDPQSGRWHYLPWDLDVGFSDNAFGLIPVISGWNAAWPVVGDRPSPLVLRILDNPQLLARYRRIADSILETHFHPQVLLPRIDELYERIKDDLASDPFPHVRATNPDDKNYQTVVASIKAFVLHRYETARAQLDHPGSRQVVAQNTPRRGHQQDPRPGNPSADAPTELRITSSTRSSVTLQWTNNSKGEAGHIVQRAESENGQEFHNVAGFPGDNVTMGTDKHVVPGKVFRYRVFGVHHEPTGKRGTGVSNVVTIRIPQ
jgi:spore coat protein CotH